MFIDVHIVMSLISVKKCLSNLYLKMLDALSKYGHKYFCRTYEVCLKSKCTDFLFKCLLDSPEITSDLLQSMTLGKLHNGSVFSTDHSNTGSHFL